VFLHCRRGADRTGTLVAMYRIARQRWTAASAYEEARATVMRWWHYPVKGYLERFASRVRTEPNLAITEASTVP
jgi:protein tyrosine/serine phosphatase